MPELNPPQIILLNKERITRELLTRNTTTPFALHEFTTIDSTNRFLKDLPLSQKVDVCYAETQTQGRGRFGRAWHSPFGENIYCSSRWNFHNDLSKFSGLSLISSLAVLAAINELTSGAEIKVKWPNDIYWFHKKLCGSLIEILAGSNGQVQVIIGIGLNVNTDTESQPLPDKPWCSLYDITKRYFDRNLIIASLLSNLERYLNKFLQYDLDAFKEEWNLADYLKGKYIHVTQSAQIRSGIARGINASGHLILEDEHGVIHLLSSGDTSLYDLKGLL